MIVVVWGKNIWTVFITKGESCISFLLALLVSNISKRCAASSPDFFQKFGRSLHHHIETLIVYHGDGGSSEIVASEES
jgi:hypothetical protein